MVSLTIDKQGRIDFDYPIKAGSNITLDYITLYFKVFNVNEETKVSIDGKTEIYKAGYFDLDLVKEKLGSDNLIFDEIDQRVKFNKPNVKGGVAKLFDNDYLYITPLVLYVYVDEIDSKENLYNGSRSKLLAMIPVGNKDFGDIIEYKAERKKIISSDGKLNSINFYIKDHNGKDYKGRFVAELTLN